MRNNRSRECTFIAIVVTAIISTVTAWPNDVHAGMHLGLGEKGGVMRDRAGGHGTIQHAREQPRAVAINTARDTALLCAVNLPFKSPVLNPPLGLQPGANVEAEDPRGTLDHGDAKNLDGKIGALDLIGAATALGLSAAGWSARRKHVARKTSP